VTELDEAVVATPAGFATDVSPRAVTTAKRQLWGDLLETDVGGSVERSRALLDELMAGPEYREGVAALPGETPAPFLALAPLRRTDAFFRRTVPAPV